MSGAHSTGLPHVLQFSIHSQLIMYRKVAFSMHMDPDTQTK